MTAPKSFPRVALDLATTVERIQQNFCICDPNLPDCPIVFASDGFLEMSEYDRFEVLGRNCRFLQARAQPWPRARCGCACMLSTIPMGCLKVQSSIGLTRRFLQARARARPARLLRVSAYNVDKGFL